MIRDTNRHEKKTTDQQIDFNYKKYSYKIESVINHHVRICLEWCYYK
jgi:hypothetical protein